MTTQEKLDAVAHYDYRVYSIPGAFVVADILDDEQGFSLIGDDLDEILGETLDFIAESDPQVWEFA